MIIRKATWNDLVLRSAKCQEYYQSLKELKAPLNHRIDAQSFKYKPQSNGAQLEGLVVTKEKKKTL
jgi:hypothetical protein